ncbi:thioredoxin fold domain-containing protein [Sulfurospirillum arcachonense]|uniref:thioredoxin fold domain-containing protein n=1 Tax=Sulfurospirillum arcachonense TaxID=57666 RepID=UPI0004691CFC|nr:thioredoxin fold domain-containing protein [Sulfurospirillum arcachonense]
MRKFVKVLGAVVFSMILASGANAVDNKHFDNLKTFKDIKGTITGNALIGKKLDLYLVKGTDAAGRPFQVVTDINGNYLILGSKVMDIKKKKVITVPLDVSWLKGKEAFTYGTGKKHFYVFTDPECPFCTKFEAKWPTLKNDVTFHVFLFNLDFHKNANAMSRWILSSKNQEEREKRMDEVSKGNVEYKNAKYSPEELKRLNKIIADQKAIGQKVGITGTPTVMTLDGKLKAWNTF